MPSRPRTLDPETQRLDLLAATQLIADAEVAHCWALIREGIQSHRLGRGNLDRVIEALRARDGITVDEFTVETEPFGSDQLVVAILDDHRTCSVARMVQELERLRGRSDGEPNGPATDEPAPIPPSQAPPAPEPGTGQHTLTSRAVSAEGSSEAAPEIDLLGVLAGLLGTTPGKLAGDPEAYRGHVERVRAASAALAAAFRDPTANDASRAAAADRLRQLLAASAGAGAASAHSRINDLPGTLGALGVHLDHLAGPLRAVAQWLEERTPDTGAAVDRLVAALDRAAEPLLGPSREHREVERDGRIRDSARAAIAARLGKLGESG
jgi:hypothetical protein